jgi:hypothetical protein
MLLSLLFIHFNILIGDGLYSFHLLILGVRFKRGCRNKSRLTGYLQLQEVLYNRKGSKKMQLWLVKHLTAGSSCLAPLKFVNSAPFCSCKIKTLPIDPLMLL